MGKTRLLRLFKMHERHGLSPGAGRAASIGAGGTAAAGGADPKRPRPGWGTALVEHNNLNLLWLTLPASYK